VAVQRTLRPIAPREAVGGQPALFRDSVVAGAVDSVGNAAFRNLNPRTAAGLAIMARTCSSW
jgi:hypothetical protein